MKDTTYALTVALTVQLTATNMAEALDAAWEMLRALPVGAEYSLKLNKATNAPA